MSAIYYDSCGHRGYIFDPSDSSWTKIGATRLNDSMVIIGRDTINISGAGGGGADNSIATGSRTATGDYTQNWNRKQLIFDTTKDVRIYSNAPDWNFTNNNHTFLFEHYHSVIGSPPLSLKWALRNVANSSDSVGGGIVSSLYSTIVSHNTGSQSGQLYLGDGSAQLAAFGGKTSTITAYNGTITLDAADSIMARLRPAATADSVVAVRSYSFGLNTLVKVPMPSGGGSADSTTFATKYGVDTGKVNLRTQIAGKQPTGNYITALTGDVTATGPGSVAAAIASNAVTTGKINNGAVTTAKIADGNVTNAKIEALRTYPSEHRWGAIYERNGWSDLSDFTPTGTANVAINGTSVDITANSNDYTPVVRVLRSRPTGLSKWKLTMRYRVTAWGGSSYWFGPALKSLITHGGANFGFIAFSDVTNGGGSNSYIIQENGTILASGGGPSKSLNDVIECTFSRADTTLTYTIRNVTTGSSTTTVNYTFPANHSVILPNLGTWGMMYNATGTGNIRLDYMKIESDETINPNILCLGDSKTAIGFSDYYDGRWHAQLKPTFPTVVYNAGSAEYAIDALTKINELMQYNPEKVIMGFVGENDIRDGFDFDATTANMQKLNDAFASGGTEVYWIGLPEDSVSSGSTHGVGLSRLNGWVKTRWPNNYIDTWDSLSTNNVLKSIYNSGDNIHLTQAAMNKIAQAINASGKLSTTYANIRTPFRATDGVIRTTGDSLSFAYNISPKASNLPKFDGNYNITASKVHDNGTNVMISDDLNPTPTAGSILLNVKGAISTHGVNAGLYIYDRSGTDYTALYRNGTSTNIYDAANGQLANFDNKGKWTFGYDVGRQVNFGTIRILNSYNYVTGQGNRGYSLNIDTSTFTATSGVPYGNASVVSIAPCTFANTSGTASHDTIASLHIEGKPIAGSGMNLNYPVSLWVNGPVKLDGTDSLTTAATNILTLDANGKINKAAVPSGGSAGSWTPTLTADANVDGTPTALHATYTRTGNIVTCYVTVSVDPTANTTQTEVGITLPVASNFTDSNDLNGTGSGSAGNGAATFVLANANTTSDRATLIFQSGSTSASIVTLTFQYTVQ